VYLRTEPLVGEQAQIDWAFAGKLAVSGGERALWLFVMVLSYSRALWGEFVVDLSVHSLCRSLVRAARAFGGVTRQWLFDNPKTVVLERNGDAVRFHPVLLELCAKMRVQPRLCAVGRPEHKGRVERAIRYLRDRFLAGRAIPSVAAGNVDLGRFTTDIALARPHPVLGPRTVGDVLNHERARLLGCQGAAVLTTSGAAKVATCSGLTWEASMAARAAKGLGAAKLTISASAYLGRAVTTRPSLAS
jgi:transposase